VWTCCSKGSVMHWAIKFKFECFTFDNSWHLFISIQIAALPCIKKVSVKKCHLAGPIEKLATTFLGALYEVLINYFIQINIVHFFFKTIVKLLSCWYEPLIIWRLLVWQRKMSNCKYISHFDVKALVFSCIFQYHYRLYFLSLGIKFAYT
jgi:hypothetical protein